MTTQLVTRAGVAVAVRDRGDRWDRDVSRPGWWVEATAAPADVASGATDVAALVPSVTASARVASGPTDPGALVPTRCPSGRSQAAPSRAGTPLRGHGRAGRRGTAHRRAGLRGGVPAVRERSPSRTSRPRPRTAQKVPTDQLVALAERLLPKLRAAEWRDKADAALADLEELGPARPPLGRRRCRRQTRDEESRTLLAQLQEGLARRVEQEQTNWIDDMTANLDAGRFVRALRLSSRPPKAGTPLPPELATRLIEAVSTGLTPTSTRTSGSGHRCAGVSRRCATRSRRPVGRKSLAGTARRRDACRWTVCPRSSRCSAWTRAEVAKVPSDVLEASPRRQADGKPGGRHTGPRAVLHPRCASTWDLPSQAMLRGKRCCRGRAHTAPVDTRRADTLPHRRSMLRRTPLRRSRPSRPRHRRDASPAETVDSGRSRRRRRARSRGCSPSPLPRMQPSPRPRSWTARLRSCCYGRRGPVRGYPRVADPTASVPASGPCGFSTVRAADRAFQGRFRRARAVPLEGSSPPRPCRSRPVGALRVAAAVAHHRDVLGAQAQELEHGDELLVRPVEVVREDRHLGRPARLGQLCGAGAGVLVGAERPSAQTRHDLGDPGERLHDVGPVRVRVVLDREPEPLRFDLMAWPKVICSRSTPSTTKALTSSSSESTSVPSKSNTSAR